MRRIIDISCPIHQHENCGIMFESTDQYKDELNRAITVPPMCVHTDKDVLFRHVYSWLATHYRLKNFASPPTILTIKEGTMKLYEAWYRDCYTPKSSIPLGRMTSHDNPMMTSNVKLASFVPALTKDVDHVIDFYRGYNNNHNIVKVNGMASLLSGKVPIKKFPMSVAPDRARTTIHSILCEELETGRGKFPQFYYATNSTPFPHLRLESLLREFSFDTAVRGDSYAKVRPLVSPALKTLEYFLDTDDYVGKLRFHYDVRQMIDSIKLTTSGGILNCPKSQTVINGVIYKICNSGKKIHLIHAAVKELHRIIMLVAKGVSFDFQPYNVTKLKGEFRYLFEKAIESIPDSLQKAREFFIPSLTITLLSDLLHRDRMLIERGTLITIGITPWYGGWYHLAKALNFDNPDIFWADGDIKSLDKHITDWQLYLYLSAGSRYYNWDGMNKSQRTFLKRLYLILQYHVTNKITLQPGTFWRLIKGVMYSGGKETSHGDSWIMALIFFMYIEHIRQNHPSSSAFIKQCLLLRFIAIIIYGDDHVWCAPKALRHIINVKSFARFLLEYCGMELRDFKEYDSFISRINHSTGDFIYQGPRFLKRYWIAASDLNISGSADVLPYKHYLEQIVRLCTITEDEDAAGGMLKAVGQAWDTLGTNILAYNVIKHVYEYCSSISGKSLTEIYNEWKADLTKHKELKALMKKSTLAADEFFAVFPSLELLQSRHAYDPSLCNNRPVVFRPSDFM